MASPYSYLSVIILVFFLSLIRVSAELITQDCYILTDHFTPSLNNARMRCERSHKTTMNPQEENLRRMYPNVKCDKASPCHCLFSWRALEV